MRLKGTKEYRFKDNPLEKRFHDAFINQFGRDHQSLKTLSMIIFGPSPTNSNYANSCLTDYEETMCVNMIQWLGSPVGQSFLRDLGFEQKEIN
jgi:hypothetical protein